MGRDLHRPPLGPRLINDQLRINVTSPTLIRKYASLSNHNGLAEVRLDLVAMPDWYALSCCPFLNVSGGAGQGVGRPGPSAGQDPRQHPTSPSTVTPHVFHLRPLVPLPLG